MWTRTTASSHFSQNNLVDILGVVLSDYKFFFHFFSCPGHILFSSQGPCPMNLFCMAFLQPIFWPNRAIYSSLPCVLIAFCVLLQYLSHTVTKLFIVILLTVYTLYSSGQKSCLIYLYTHDIWYSVNICWIPLNYTCNYNTIQNWVLMTSNKIVPK